MAFYIYKDLRNEWRWYLMAANGKKIADSGEGYVNEAGCLHGISLVMSAHRATPIYRR